MVCAITDLELLVVALNTRGAILNRALGSCTLGVDTPDPPAARSLRSLRLRSASRASALRIASRFAFRFRSLTAIKTSLMSLASASRCVTGRLASLASILLTSTQSERLHASTRSWFSLERCNVTVAFEGWDSSSRLRASSAVISVYERTRMSKESLMRLVVYERL